MPPDAYMDDPAEKIDPADANPEEESRGMASEVLSRAFGWTMQQGTDQCSLRTHILLLFVRPDALPCKRPSLSWCGQVHGVSRQRAWVVWQSFKREFGGHMRFPVWRKGSRPVKKSKGKNKSQKNMRTQSDPEELKLPPKMNPGSVIPP